jgi:uncharacterized protein YkwD
MKAIIKTSFSAKVQASQFNPVESNDGLELEIEVADENELAEKIEHFQKIIREKVVKSVIEGVNEIRAARAKMLLEMDEENK